MCIHLGLCVFVCTGVSEFAHIFESVRLNASLIEHFYVFCIQGSLYGSMCVCVFVSVLTSRISVQIDYYNQLSTRICHISFWLLDHCLLPGNISLLDTTLESHGISSGFVEHSSAVFWEMLTVILICELKGYSIQCLLRELDGRYWSDKD